MKQWFAKWIGWVRVLAFFGLLCGILIRVGDPQPIKTLRNASFDFYHQSKPREFTRLPVAILDVDDSSIEEIGQWPWPRKRMAELVERATAQGAVAIGFDIIFSEPDRLSPGQIAQDNPDMPPSLAAQLAALPDNDTLLAEAFARSRVIVGQSSVRTTAGNRVEKREMAKAAHALIGPSPMPYLMHFPDILQNLPELEATAAGRGMFNARPDPDGVYRRVPLVMSVQGQIRLGLTPELLRVATGGESFAVRTNEAGIEGIVLARQLIPTAHDGTVWPYLTPSLRARYVSAADLLKDRVPVGRLAGHLVLVGTSAIGLEDFRATPLGVAMAGVEVHAQVLENIMAKTLLVRPNYTIAIELVTTFVLCALVIIFAPSLSARVLISSSLVLLAGYVGASYYLFVDKRVLLDPSFPIVATTTAVMLISTVNYLREERQRREIRSAFGQYVSPDLVDQLSRNQGKLTLGGESRDLTLLFSDVRGFTAIAEEFRDDPEALTLLMNQFLTILSNAIMHHKGTIDKFMGDAVMAFWNAPLDNEDHARAACRAALQMIRDVKAFNAKRLREAARLRKARQGQKRKAGMPRVKTHRINVGIGINTGQCVVGNMGSDTRFDYTALGDPVNVASRLEGQSRYYGAAIILGQATAREVGSDFAVMELDRVRVVGKEVPETIFALLGDETLRQDPEFQSLCDTNTAMLAAYRSRQWDTAEALLSEVSQHVTALRLGLKDYLDMYRGRIADLRAAAPPEDWDGVFASTKK
ncbi:adenylate/guanylate cyclase domain-containing protein [Roseobacter sp. YSTF-M11]|uniref:Adenylate/guanylate cyclase domain-containing protein n=1 Tax=Roseobacter insulae TaxID=2859783 RepID=A0A9X1FZQ8_9RHOB|nr:adenylate/guanylate cyclase domain-containing protein [Roseobacter insulae]MBW4710676.1 adenylate/guanylate cyclase domain-containing protein [Roseobacter insulae]